jgi:PAS domain S-box-containing protein
MVPSSLNGVYPEGNSQVLWEDGDRVFCRGWRLGDDGNPSAVLVVLPAAERPSPSSLDRLAHEYGLKDELDGAWAVQPLELVRDGGRTMLVLEDPGGEPLDRLLGAPMETGRFLRLAIGIVAALGKAHQRGLVHKDLKPANILAHCPDGRTRLTGFGIASCLPRERRAPEPPGVITGTLAYMAPEQTGRMNRSVDSRSDLYSLGVVFYQMLTGRLPFSAADPMEWVHSHIARTPAAPAERLESVPVPISEIVMRLLAKTAEDRYQIAAGVEHDLRHCLGEWERHGRVEPFVLGERDRPDRLMIPEKLYGRERDVESLLCAFDRVVEGGAPELVLVSGYSGIGKSSVVNELHKTLVPSRGIFASGKFDQLKRDIPYSTLARAFESLVRSLLIKSDIELARWRRALLEMLGPNGRLLTDIIPELIFVIGEQPPVPELESQQSKARFHLVFRRFINVFARAEHPLALFLDDLQWLDAATLDLIVDLLTQADVRNLLLVGAYRDNEVDAGHPLMRKLDAISAAGVKVVEITLAPLKPEHLGYLIADALRCEAQRAAPLAQLIHEKTGGNPFFAIQFLSSLAEDGLLSFDFNVAGWLWNIDRTRARPYSDNVADLMVGKLTRLPDDAQKALRQLACLGNVVELSTLAIILGTSEVEIDAALWEALSLDLVERLSSAYQFVHDRVQEAAYSLIPQTQRAAAHLRIGRLLLASTSADNKEETIFEVVNHLNRGAALVSEPQEREQLADLNWIAGSRAKASTAYAAALAYFNAGAAFLPQDSWKRRHDLAFALELGRAECEFLTGAHTEADHRLATLGNRTLRLPELAAVARLREDLYMTLGRSDRAVDICLDYLRHVEIAWSAHPTKEEVRQEYERIWRRIGSRSIEELLDLPPMTDPEQRGTMEVLIKAATPARFIDQNLEYLVIGRMVNLSLEHGNSDASCYAYALVGAVLGSEFGDYTASSRFGKLALDLVEGRGLDRFEAGVYLVLAIDIIPWTQPIRGGRSLTQRAFDAAERLGDRTFAGYSCAIRVFDLIATGDPLRDVQIEAEGRLDFVRKLSSGLQVDIITPPLQLIRTMRGLTPIFGSFNDAEFDEAGFERHLESEPGLAVAACLYWIRKLQALVLARDYVSALAAAAQAERLLWTSVKFFQFAEYHLYAALARAALCDSALVGERAQYLETLAAHHRQLETWAANCPENFENRAALVGAEIARLDGREIDAERLYEQAIRSARVNGFVHNEALAYEWAARFYEMRGFEDFAHVYLQRARDCYLRWGADGKVRQLEESYPRLRTKDFAHAPTSTIQAPVEALDLATVIKVSQAISGEIVLEKLLETLMRTAVEHAGAERVLFITPRGDELRVEAEAITNSEQVVVHLPTGAHASPAMPESLVRYVIRTEENVILDDATSPNPFAADPYFVQRPSRSLICLPSINRAKVTGVLLLENNLAPRVFSPARISVLTLVASHAAIALENARLYRDVQEREMRQSATSKMLRIISNSPIQSVLDAVAENAARLSDAGNAEIFRLEDNLLRLVASYGEIPVVINAYRGVAANRDTVTGRAACDRRTIHVHDLAAEGDEYPVGSSNAKREGHRTTLATPLLRESAPVGIILVRRREVRPFSGEEIALVETFADHAVIAIENARLFEAEKQRALALARANRDLQDREGKIRRLIESNIIGVFFGDFDGQILEANDAFLGIVGYDREDLAAGRINWKDLTPRNWRDRDAQWIDEHKRTGVRQPIEKEFYRKDGTRVPILLGAATFEEAGNLSVTFVLDLTERKRTEVALQESQAKFRDYAETASDWFWEIDPEYKFTLLTENAFGSGAADRIGTACWDHALDLESEPEKWRLIRTALDSRQPFRDFVYRALGGNGLPMHVRSSGKPVVDADGRFRGYRGTGSDVTASIRALEEHERLRQLESDLAHMNRLSMMGELAASLAHEIAQPVGSARNNARAALNFLEKHPPDLREVKEALSCVVGDAGRAGSIIDWIRDHIKKAPLRMHHFDLTEMINEVILLARSAIAKNGVSVQTRLTEGLAPIDGDRVQLQQVILNLILNAAEAMGAVDDGLRELVISAEQSQTNGIVVAVRDSGPGIDPDNIERVFEAFYTTKSSGVGMGLSICRSIIEAHGGRLWAEVNELRGAAFRFTLHRTERNS